MDTIYALSSGRPPAAIAIVRVSGAGAFEAVRALAGSVPAPRRATLRTLRDADGASLDQALVLVFPGPATATGEDLAEFHLHGGRAVVAAVEQALGAMPGLRAAEAGEFTRRSLLNGRIDLAQAQGLADLLEAETETQRRAALTVAEGAVSRALRDWLDRLSYASALVEAAIDYSDEDDVDTSGADYLPVLEKLTGDMREVLAAPPVERLRDGIRVVLAGPPNAGKSSLFNALLGRDAAIVTPIAGTTRDMIEADVVRAGVAYRLIDTAGLRLSTDLVEEIGIDRAHGAIAAADVILWLGEGAEAPEGAIRVHPRADEIGRETPLSCAVATSIQDQPSIDAVWGEIERRGAALLPRVDDLTLRLEQRRLVAAALDELEAAACHSDDLLAAEHLRRARGSLAAILGEDATEVMLDALFTRFCVGK